MFWLWLLVLMLLIPILAGIQSWRELRQAGPALTADVALAAGGDLTTDQGPPPRSPGA